MHVVGITPKHSTPAKVKYKSIKIPPPLAILQTSQNQNFKSNFNSIYGNSNLNFCQNILKPLEKKENTDFSKTLEQKQFQHGYNFNSIYGNSNLNFCQNILKPLEKKENTDFSKTLEQNWFQLGSFELPDGSKAFYEPDTSQLECALNLFQGNSVIYCAPTGSGKTAVANYAITKNLNENKRTIYTSPLKALANDKYREFCAIYGKENVGILTGDIKFNTQAPIRIMTTEIYNNLACASFGLENTGTVIFDEAHYIADSDRGNVWENSIMNTPKGTQILCLSATIGNVPDLTNWVQSQNKTKKAAAVVVNPNERHVPLVYYIYSLKDNEFLPLESSFVDISSIDPNSLTVRQKRAIETIFRSENNISGFYKMNGSEYVSSAQKLLENLTLDDDEENSPIFQQDEFEQILRIIYKNLTPVEAKEITQLLSDSENKTTNKISLDFEKSNYPVLVQNLQKNEMLPSIIFSLSIKGTQDIIEKLKESGIDLTTEAEKEEIKKIIEKYNQDNVYLGRSFDIQALLKGFASHNSGLLPQYRKLIEELFSKKLIKVVAATSTLSAGINMPARTVVATGLNYMKFDPETQEVTPINLTPSEFHQMAGRAGRRAIDKIGNVVFYNLRNKKEDENGLTELDNAYRLIDSEPENLRSQFKPDPVLLANYWSNHTDKEGLNDLIKSSFKMYLSKNPQKELKSFENKFKRYEDVLLKQWYLVKNHRGEISLTPKGEILRLSQGLNPLMLSGLIYEESLKGLSPSELCQIVSLIAGSDEQIEHPDIADFCFERLKSLLTLEQDSANTIKGYKSANEAYQNLEARVLKSLKEGKIKKEDLKSANSFHGFIGFMWTHLNTLNPNDSVNNFKKLTRKLDTKTNDKEMANFYNSYALEGKVYKVLSQSVSALAQIERICDFALSNPDLYSNASYYKELKETAKEAIKLMKQPPIYDELSL